MSEIHTGRNLLSSYQRLIEISRDLASTLELDILLNRIVQAAVDLSYAEVASILLYDHANKQLTFEATTNIEKPLLQGLLVPMDSLAGWIVENRQPLLIPDVSKDERHFNKIAKTTNFETRSLIGVPLVTKEKVIGVLEALNKISGEFNQTDLELLNTLASQAAIAIENARLFLQSDLIAEFVHELRTPLASLSTAAHLLTRPEMSEEQRARTSQTIYEETLRLTEMASSFLDFSRLESGRVHFHYALFPVEPVIEECLNVMRSRAQERKQEIEFQSAKTLPTLAADRNKLKQVLLNLLSNAIKYTPVGGKITVETSQDAEHIRIAICDTGLGIMEAELGRLFEKFYRSSSADRSTPGTGLGLAISKRIVEGHGGRIEVRSKYGQGSIFTVVLPKRRKLA